MITAELHVASGNKLNKDHQEKIRDRLSGKKLEVVLDADDVDDKRAIVNLRGVEKDVVQALRDQAPLLAHAKGFVFKKQVKSAGDCKLVVQIEDRPAFFCTLLLQAPLPKPVEKSAGVTFDKLYDKGDFADLLTIRFCRASIQFTLNHPGAESLIKKIMPALRPVETEVVKEVDKAIDGTVAALRKGLKAEGSETMTWKDAKELVDQLNKDVQRIINGIADKGDAALNKALSSASPGLKTDCSVTAMFSKFEVAKTVHFTGSGEPSANEKSIKPLETAVKKLHAAASGLDKATVPLAKAGLSYCAAVTTLLARNAKAAQPDAGVNVKEVAAQLDEKNLQDAFRKQVETNLHLREGEEKTVEQLSRLVEKIKDIHRKEKAGAGSSDDKKNHAVLTRGLDHISKQVDEFGAALKKGLDACWKLSDHLGNPRSRTEAGCTAMKGEIQTIEDARLEVISKRLSKMCEIAVDMIEAD